MFSGKKITIMVVAVIFLLVVGNGVMAQDNESIGLDLSLGVTGTDLTGTAGAAINLGIAYGFTLWGYDMEVGIDTFDYAFVPESDLSLVFYFSSGGAIGESDFFYFSDSTYALYFTDGTYSGDYCFGAGYSIEDVDVATFGIDWIYTEDKAFDSTEWWPFKLIFDAVAGAGYEFDFGPAGSLALWADFTIGMFDATGLIDADAATGMESRFGLNSIDATLDYTYYITDMIPLTAGVELVLSPMDNFEHELSASISAGIEL